MKENRNICRILWVFLAIFCVGAFVIFTFPIGRYGKTDIGGRTVEQWLIEYQAADFHRRIEIRGQLTPHPDSVVPALIHYLEREPHSVHIAGVRLWNRFSAQKIVEPNYDGTRAAAAQLLGEFGENAASAVPALMDAAAGSVWNVSEPARIALLGFSPISAPVMARRLGGRENLDEQLEWVEIIDAMDEKAAVATTELVSAVGRTDDQLASKIIGIFEHNAHHQPPVTQLLLQVVETRGESVKRAALLVLGNYQSITSEIRAAVDQALTSDEFGVRFCAAVAHCRLGQAPARALPILVDGLADAEFRVSAVSLLGDLGPTADPAIDELLATLVEERNPRPLRMPPSAGVALSRIGENALPGLIELLENEDHFARLNAVLTLGVFGRRGALAAESLVPLLKDENSDVQQATALALSNIGYHTRDAIPVLSVMTEDDDPFVATWAGEALSEIDQALKPLGAQ